MSASIFYQPVKGKHLPIGAPSSFLSALEKALGPPPWTIYDRDHDVLRGLAAGLESKDQQAAAITLAEAAYNNGEIRVWAEY